MFTQRFLSTLGNLRGILHQGVEAWLTSLVEEGDADPTIRLLAEIDVEISRADAAELLSIAIEAVVENYRVYRDYNTTTTQSDHGELLYQFIDFLRQRAAYDRVAWNLKPVVWAHEILVRHRRDAAAEMWRQAFAERTSEAADLHLKRLTDLGVEYGMQLPTIVDRLNERFVRPLVIDQLRAMVEPAMNGHGDAAQRVVCGAGERNRRPGERAVRRRTRRARLADGAGGRGDGRPVAAEPCLVVRPAVPPHGAGADVVEGYFGAIGE